MLSAGQMHHEVDSFMTKTKGNDSKSIIRLSIYFTLGFPLILLYLISCSSMQTARIRQEVTIDTYSEKQIQMKAPPTIMVLTLAQEEKTLSKTTRTANEAAADILSLELRNRGLNVVDRAVINDYMKENRIKMQANDLERILDMGGTLNADLLILTNLFENLQGSHAINFLPGDVLTTVDTSANIGITARMINLKENEVVWVGIATTQDLNFQMAIQRISEKLIASLGIKESK